MCSTSPRGSSSRTCRARPSSARGYASAGRAEIFNVTNGSLLRNLTSPSSFLEVDGYFGYSAAIKHGRALVGAPEDVVIHQPPYAYYTGSAYLFNATSGALDQDLISPETSTGSAIFGEFGGSVALSASLALVGAYNEFNGTGASNLGHAYVFDASSGALDANLTNRFPQDQGDFGYSVGLDGNVALVGAPYGEGGRVSSYQAV